MARTGGKLTNLQRLFVQEYLVDLNARAAAERAGYSPKTARHVVQRLLSHPRINEAIQDAIKTRESRIQISQDAVVQELAKIGFANMGQFVRWNDTGVQMVASSDLTTDQTAAIIEITDTTNSVGNRNIKLKLGDKIRALELLGKHLGMFSDRIQHSGSIGVMIVDDIPRPRGDDQDPDTTE